MKITYTGDLTTGQLQCPTTSRTFKFTKGDVLDVPDALGQSAVKQGQWKEATDAEWSEFLKQKKAGEERRAAEEAKAAKKPAAAKKTTAPGGTTEEK